MLDIPRPRVLLFLWACCAAVAAPAAEKNEAATDAYTAASTAASTLVQAARLVTGVVDGVATLTPYQPPMDPVVTARNAELALASGRSAAYAVGNHSETSGKGPGERQTKALSAALVAAERAVVLALAAAHDAAAASKMAERARASAIEAQALAAEVVVFVAAAQTAGSDATSNAASRNADVSISSSNHDVVAWTSASLTDKWLVEEVYPHRRGHDAPPLYFVDVGANDGVSLSQTMALESSFGWRGVCVEASDPHFAALELSRPNCFNAHACLASIPNQTVDFALDHAVLINGGGGGSGSTGGAFSGMYGGIVSTNTGIRNGWDASAAPTQSKQTQTLAEVLKSAQAPSFVEFLSLDCEGCELDVLSTFPFGDYNSSELGMHDASRGAEANAGDVGSHSEPPRRTYAFGAIVVEHNHETHRRRQIRSLLEQKGYLRAKAGSPDDYYVLNDPTRVPLSANLPPPYTDPKHRRQLLTSAETRKEPQWACPLSLNAVLERGNPSSACPLPSAHDGYTAATSPDNSNGPNTAPATVVREVSRVPLTCIRSNNNNNGGGEDSFKLRGGPASLPTPGAFTRQLEALGAYAELARAIQSTMTEHAREDLCASLRQGPHRDDGSGNSVRQPHHAEVAIAWSLVPGYTVMLRGIGGSDASTSGGVALEYATLSAEMGAAAHGAAAAGGVAALELASNVAAASAASGGAGMEIGSNVAATKQATYVKARSSGVPGGALAVYAGEDIGQHMRAICEHIATEEGLTNCMAAARPLPQALASFRAALAGKPPPWNLSTANSSGNGGDSSSIDESIRDAHKLLKLQVYADACVLTPSPPSSTQAQGEPTIVASPDTDCVSLAWWLSFNLPSNAEATKDGGGAGGADNASLELTMELIGRVDNDANDEVDMSSGAPFVGLTNNAQASKTRPSTELLLRRAAAAGLVGPE